jgi:hemoglobin
MIFNWYTILGQSGIEKLVHTFYSFVFADPQIAHLFHHPKAEIEAKQIAFLTQFLGGPTVYTSKFGVPKMRYRHLPHAITQEAKEAWLNCMKMAIDTLELTETEKISLFACFVPLANHMVNC